MPRPKGSKNKPHDEAAAKVTKIANDPPEGLTTGIVSVDMDAISKSDYQKLLEQNAELLERLAASDAARGKAEQAALDATNAQSLMYEAPTQERPTGRFIEVEKCVGYKRVGWEHGRAVREPVLEMVKVPTYFYKVVMAPCGGLDLKINGQPFMHGVTYEVDVDTLRTMKDIVWRTWTHDKSIHGDSDENAYRKPTNPVLNARAY